jgi:hypothetical protein
LDLSFSKTNNSFPNLSIFLGIDAQIALDFHHLRRDTPELCASVVLNKFWYATYGAKALFTGLENLEDFITLIVDGKQVFKLPYIGFNSYSAVVTSGKIEIILFFHCLLILTRVIRKLRSIWNIDTYSRDINMQIFAGWIARRRWRTDRGQFTELRWWL